MEKHKPQIPQNEQNATASNGWEDLLITEEEEKSSWENISEVEDENIPEEEKMFKKYDHSFNKMAEALNNAKFFSKDDFPDRDIKTVSEAEKSDKLKQKVENAINQIDTELIEKSLNSEFRFKFFEKLYFLQTQLAIPQTEKIRQIISDKVYNFIKQNPSCIDLKDFFENEKNQDIFNNDMPTSVKYKDKEYYRSAVVEGVFLTYRMSGDKSDPKINEIMKENASKITVDEVINSGGLLYENVGKFYIDNEDEKFKNSLEICINEKVLSGHDSEIANVLKSQNPLIQGSAEKIIKNQFEKEFGISNFNLGPWKEGSFKYTENLRLMKQIEQQIQGSVKKLYEDYGIIEFQRYPKEILIAQIKDEDKDRPYGVVVFPRSDHNGAFDNQKEMFLKLMIHLQGKYGIKIAECDSKFDMARKFISLDNKFGNKNKISFVVLGGHGSKNSISLGAEDPRFYNFDKTKSKKVIFNFESNNKSFKKANEKFLNKNAEILFLSCSTGQEGGIAENFSESFGKKISAPKIPVSKLNINVDFDNQNGLHLEAVYNEDESLTAKYLGKKE